jgi:hypothetical protein
MCPGIPKPEPGISATADSRDNSESYIGAEPWCKRQNKPETDTDSDCGDSNFVHNHFC